MTSNVGNFRWSIDERKPTEVRVGFIFIFISKFYTFIARENSVGPCILFLSHFNEEVSWYSSIALANFQHYTGAG